MSSKITLGSFSSFQNDNTAVTLANANNAVLTTAMDNTLSRDGTSPNQMGAALDMNSFPILNLPAPVTNASPIRIQDVTSTTLSLSFPSLVGDVTAPVNNGALTTTIATNAVTNTKVAQVPANTIKGNNTGSLANVQDLTVPQIKAMLSSGFLRYVVTGVNFNAGNTDTPITITLPTGVSRYAMNNIRISNASASISTATVGIFTGAGGTGQTIAANQAITVTATAADTNNNIMNLTLTNAGSMAYTDATLQIRVGTAQGSTATADVIVIIVPLT